MKTPKLSIIKLTLLTLLAMLSHFVAAQQAPYSLDQCISMALANNAQSQNSKLDAQSSEYKIKEVRSALFPTVDFSSQFSYYTQLPSQYVPAKSFGGPEGQYNKITMGVPQSSTVGLQVSQALFNQSAITALKAARTWQQAADLQVDLSREDIIYNVATTYYSIQVLQDNLVRTHDNIINLEKTVAINEHLKKNDIVSENVHNRLLINLENLRNQFENQLLVKEKNLALLKYLMGIDSDEPIVIEEFNYEDTIEAPTEADIHDRNDIKLQQVNIKLAEFDKKTVVAGYYPTSFLGFNYGITGYNSEFGLGKAINNDWIKSSAISISLKVPVFDGLNKHYRIKQRDIAIRKHQNSLQMMKSNAARELQDAISNYTTSANQYVSNKKSMALAEQLFKSSQSEFETGIISTSEFLNAQTDLTNARSNYSSALLNLKLAELSWKKASGKLTQDFDNN